MVVGCALLLLAWAGTRSHRRSRLELTADGHQRFLLLAGMVADALRHPAAWRHASAIWFKPILPCVGGGRISLARMVRLARADALFAGRAGGELVAEARRCRAAVLDLGDPYFGNLIARLEGLRDLGALEKLKPAVQAPTEVRGLVEALDDLLRRVRTGIACRALPLPDGRLFSEVDLDPIRPRRRSGWPRRTLAVNPADRRLRSLADLYRASPGPALAVAVDWLASRSRLLIPWAEALRRAAAARAFEAKS